MANQKLLFEMLEATSASDSGFAVNDRDHAVQVATRARRSGADDEIVVAALFHDAATSIDAYSHGDVIARMLAPHVRPAGFVADPLESFRPEVGRVLAQRREVRPSAPVHFYRRILRTVFHVGGKVTSRLVRV